MSVIVPILMKPPPDSPLTNSENALAVARRRAAFD
jgi:hypothetical protein